LKCPWFPLSSMTVDMVNNQLVCGVTNFLLREPRPKSLSMAGNELKTPMHGAIT
jgi:hypothetical protein